MALRIRSPDLNESNFLTVEGKRVDKSQTLVKLRGDGCWGDIKYSSKNYSAKDFFFFFDNP